MNRLILALFFLVFLSSIGFAQISDNDASFNVGDFGQGNAANNTVQTVSNLSNGKIIIGGNFTAYNSTPVNFIARLHSDGTLDNTFNVSANSNVVTSLIQPDGKIIIGGGFTIINGVAKNRITRLNADGTLDNTFNASANATIRIVVIQSDGKLIIGGHFTSVNGVTRSGIARLNTDGSLDLSFNPVPMGLILAIAIQPDSKIIIGGANDFARLNSDGSIDASFDVGTGFAGAFGDVYSCSIQSDGKVIVGGDYSMYNGVARNCIVRLNTDGTLDTSFSASTGLVRSTIIQPDGKILIGGEFFSYNGISQSRIARLNTDGTLDPGFNAGSGIGGSSGCSVWSLAIQPDGKINVGGVFFGYNGFFCQHLFRVENSGAFDEAFNLTTGINKFVSTTLLQPDGKILIGGGFTLVNGLVKNGITRLNSDGTVDSAFDIGSGANNTVRSINLQPDGKIIVAGEFTTLNGTITDHIVRLNSDGSLDPGFNSINGTNGNILATYLQPDGKIIIAGAFTLVDGVSRNRIARLNSDGTLDSGFDPGAGANSYISSITLQPDGKIIIAGAFYQFNGLNRHYLARLNADGSLDLGFINGFIAASNTVSTTVLQPDGKIVIGGFFTLYNGTTINRIARLNTDGTIDNSFNPGAGFNEYVRVVLMQPDGKFLVGGDFTMCNGVSRNGIARLNDNGSLDASFDPGTGVTDLAYYSPFGSISSIIIQDDGRIVIGGDFISYNGVGRNRIARILNCSPITISTTTSNVSCNGGSDGAISASISGGFPPYLYSWAPNGESTSTISNLSAGSYNLTTTDSIGCTKTNTTSISQPVLNATSFSASACIDYSWNNQTYSSSGSFQQTFVATNGCDSLVTLNLTILTDSVIDNQTSCDSLTWIDGNSYYASTNTPMFTLQNAAGCDSIITLNLTILNSTSATESQIACGSFTWPINNQTYTISGQYIDTIPNAAGCDSIVTLNLTIIPDLPLAIDNSFSMPSDANSCIGEAAIDVSGNAPFELDFDSGSQVITSNGYSLVTGLCAGVHDLQVTDNCGDTLSTTVIIPVDSNYVFNNPFIDSLAQDSLGVTLTNCDIYYAGIDTAYIDSIWATGNTVNVIWNIVDSNGSNFDTTSYVLNNGNGVYWLQLSVFCPFKAVGEYFTVTEAIYFNNGSVSTASLADIGKNQFEIYPNPTNDQVHITFSGSEAELTVYDVQGKVVLKNRIQNQEIISLQNFERGVYLFDFSNSNGHSVQRVVKQ